MSEQLADFLNAEVAIKELMTAALRRASANRLLLARMGERGLVAEAETSDGARVDVRIYDDHLVANGSIDTADRDFARQLQSDGNQIIFGYDHGWSFADHETSSESCVQVPVSIGKTLVGILLLEGREAALDDSLERKLIELLAAQVLLILQNEKSNRLLRREAGIRSLAESHLADVRNTLVYEAKLSVLGKLCATIIHEMKQKIASITANAAAGVRWLEREAPDLQEAVASLQRVVHDAAQSGDIIRSVSALYGGGPVASTRFDLTRNIKDVVSLVDAETRIHRIDVRLSLGDAPLVINGDDVLINQVFANLVTNAIDAMKVVDDDVRILSIRSWREGADRIWLEIADSGSGLPPTNERPAATHKHENPKGFGLGLNFCKDVVRRHSGTIELRQREPRGCLVRISLPTAADTSV